MASHIQTEPAFKKFPGMSKHRYIVYHVRICHNNENITRLSEEKMKNKSLLVVLGVLAILSISCGLFNTISNLAGGASGNAEGTVSSLWPDVPEMEGMAKADLSLPLPARLAIEAFVKASSKNQGSLNLIAFTSNGSIENVTSYYTLERMQENGWNESDQPGCTSDTGQSESLTGAGCFFLREDPGDKGSILAIFVVQNSKTNQTEVYFARFDFVNISTLQP